MNRDFQDSHNFEVPAAGHEECEDDTCEVSEERDDLEEHPELIDVYHVPHSQRQARRGSDSAILVLFRTKRVNI